MRDQQRQNGLLAPVAWTGKDVRSVALWVSGFQPPDFEFVVDQIEFYGNR